VASPPEALAQAQLEWDTPLYRMAVAQFDVEERLRYPERSIIVSVPVRMDDGRRVVFLGVPRPALEHRGPDKRAASATTPPSTARRMA
jgi:glutamate dehydrogenase/leucine dehydrogenase